MFGIDDPGIWMAYLLAVVCLVFSIYWGISRWNRDYDSDTKDGENKSQSKIVNNQHNSEL